MVAPQAPLSMEFSRQEYWHGLPCPSPGDLPDPGIKPRSPALQADFYHLSWFIIKWHLALALIKSVPLIYACMPIHFSLICDPGLCDPMDCSPPGSSVHGILQARILEWVAISFSRESSRPRDRTQISRIAGRRFNLWATREAPMLLLLLLSRFSCVQLCATPETAAHR